MLGLRQLTIHRGEGGFITGQLGVGPGQFLGARFGGGLRAGELGFEFGDAFAQIRVGGR